MSLEQRIIITGCGLLLALLGALVCHLWLAPWVKSEVFYHPHKQFLSGQDAPEVILSAFDEGTVSSVSSEEPLLDAD